MNEYPKINSVEKQKKREIKIVYRPPFEEKKMIMEEFGFYEPLPKKEKDTSLMTLGEISIYDQECKIYKLKLELAKTAYISKY